MDRSFVNVALNRPARQSSLSQWSKPNDACRAVSGVRSQGFSFSTDVEREPFWIVDLQSPFPIWRIVIYNREDDCSDRVCPLVIETSLDETEWREIATIKYVFGGVKTGLPLNLQMKYPLEVQYLRLRRTGDARIFHLSQVEIYTSIEDIPGNAQLGQDRWVLEMTGGRSGGTFVEIGAVDGIHFSNTFVLEKRFGWRGVCVEPNPKFYAKLVQNRTAKTFPSAVFSESGRRLKFAPHDELGTLIGFENSDFHRGSRKKFMDENDTIEVETISPDDLIEQAEMPALIDFLSLDTEGSELDILQAMDFSRHRFGMIAVEHNMVTDKRSKIYHLLKDVGYTRFSVKWDDWYYHPTWLDTLNGAVRVDFDAVMARRSAIYGDGKEIP